MVEPGKVIPRGRKDDLAATYPSLQSSEIPRITTDRVAEQEVDVKNLDVVNGAD